MTYKTEQENFWQESSEMNILGILEKVNGI